LYKPARIEEAPRHFLAGAGPAPLLSVAVPLQLLPGHSLARDFTNILYSAGPEADTSRQGFTRLRLNAAQGSSEILGRVAQALGSLI
jgi:hypothetical protein